MTNPAQIAATGAVSPVTTGQTYSVHDLAHAKGVPSAAREAMLLMQDRINQQDAVIAGLVEALEQITEMQEGEQLWYAKMIARAAIASQGEP